jgi:hypothetical protein
VTANSAADVIFDLWRHRKWFEIRVTSSTDHIQKVGVRLLRNLFSPLGAPLWPSNQIVVNNSETVTDRLKYRQNTYRKSGSGFRIKLSSPFGDVSSSICIKNAT